MLVLQTLYGPNSKAKGGATVPLSWSKNGGRSMCLRHTEV